MAQEYTVQNAIDVYKRGDLAMAVNMFETLAQRGEPFAQFSLGYMFRKGEGVAQDDAKAAEWYRKAAAQGHPAAQSNIAFMYEHGYGVPQDLDEAIGWYGRAAASGDSQARVLAYILSRGKSIVPLLAKLGDGDFSIHPQMVSRPDGAALTLPGTPNQSVFAELAKVGWAREAANQPDGLSALGGKAFELTDEGRQALQRILPLAARQRLAA
ncbi:tetratricopeptide repeat protein [Rhizobium sp. LjRoot254]|uniref:tetratricopeptide repeat protein n=1 Tax=Rhizobium sp. LjRoot254 TaxID=3342297 RepID=UPI003ECF31C6